MNLSDAIGLEIERREEVPERVRRCTTHHHACDCREWAHEQAIIAREQEIEEQARLLGASGSREAELMARVEALEKALESIANPVTYLQKEAERDGYRLNSSALAIASDAEFLKELARAALQEPTK